MSPCARPWPVSPTVRPSRVSTLAFNHSIDRKKIHELATCRFIDHGDNVVLLGPPGTGQAHLAVALGLKAIHRALAPCSPRL